MPSTSGAIAPPAPRTWGIGGLFACILSLILLPIGLVQGLDSIPISHAPPYLLKGVPPNLVLTLDNSGSMRDANSSAELGTANAAARRFDASDTASISNPQYYDPALVYLPPLRADGSMHPHALFSAAPRDFFRNSFCSTCQDGALAGALAGSSCAELCPTLGLDCTIDLATHYAPIWQDFTDTDNPLVIQESCGKDPDGLYWGTYVLDPLFLDQAFLDLIASATTALERRQLYEAKAASLALACMHDGVPTPDNCAAFYHRVREGIVYSDSGGTVATCSTDGFEAFWEQATQPQRSSWVETCLERVEVGSTPDLEGTGSDILTARQGLLGGSGESDQQLAERNFANWYAYYRNRWFTLQTVVTRAAAELDPSVRLAYQPLVEGSTAPDSPFVQQQLFGPFGPFNDERRQWFLDWLFATRADAWTPLIASAVRIHNFCGDDRTYLDDPQSIRGTDNPIRACRNQFHLIFTDGGWNDDSRGFAPPAWLTNNDGTAQDLPAADASLSQELGVTRYGDDVSTRLYRDSNSGGLADVVFHSWITDLRPNEDDLVRTLIRDPVVPSDVDPSYVFWNPKNDPADWQHITTFTAGLGLAGDVSYPSGDYGDGLNIRTSGFPGGWTAFSAGSAPSAAERIDDLWHAGINGRGGYSSAKDPEALLESFRRVFATVSEAVKGDAAAAAPSFGTGSASAARYVLQATLNTADWTGDLRAFRVSGGPGVEPCPEANKPPGALCEDPGVDYSWSLADQLDGNPSKGIPPRLWTTRRLVTGTVAYSADGTRTDSAIPFGSGSWGSLSEDDQRALLGLTDPGAALPAGDSIAVQEAKAVMDFIAGKAESDPFAFRERESLVGDFINAAPVIVGTPNRIFNDPTYLAFATENQDRIEIAYAGANDGLLRGIALETGTELFAYVPRPLFGKLTTLTQPGYGSDPQHTNFVDGPIAEGDAYFGGAGTWNSVVVGALGAGAQAVYAIRSPSLDDGSDVDATKIHLWDFTDRDDPDLGYVFGKPAIVRVLMSDDSIRWVAVFGNGYSSSQDDGARPAGCDDPNQDSGSSACGRAVLYVVDIETGRLIAKLDTQSGRSDDPRHPNDVSAQEPNGLAQPTVVGRVLTDSDGNPLGGGDPIATIAYAGDLFGNLWRFNLTRLSANSTAGPTPVRVFQARGPAGVAQPITAPVALAPHPTGVGTLVLFGTGRYLGQPDVTDLSVQSFYGVWDQGGSVPVSADALLEQEFLETGVRVTGSDSSTVISEGRTSTRNAIDWSIHEGWRLDLVDTEEGQPTGERVVSAPQLRGDRVVFVSLIPESDPCKAGGSSWVNAVAFTSGSGLNETPFDFDLSGTFDSADLLDTGSGTPVAGTSMRLAAGGIYSSPAALVLPGGETLTLISSSQGDLVQLRESSALRWRVWHQLQ
jgi:type IV pilus assembly protein PilY1